MQYTIYQLPINNHMKFREYVDGKLTIDDYVRVYNGTIEGTNVLVCLENIFELLNCNHPEDYYGHSLSVSDVIRLDDKFYYVQPIGYREVFTDAKIY